LIFKPKVQEFESQSARFFAYFNLNVFLIDNNRSLCHIDYVATDYQKSGNNKIFVRHISEKKILSKIPMFCLRKTGNFKAMLPENRLTWNKTKKFPYHKLIWVRDTKIGLSISIMAFEKLCWQGWVALKKSYLINNKKIDKIYSENQLRVIFFKGTSNIRHISAETILYINKRFSAPFNQLNLLYCKLLHGHFRKYFFFINKSTENLFIWTFMLIRYHRETDYYQENIHFD
jgi:hypothetical protein